MCFQIKLLNLPDFLTLFLEFWQFVALESDVRTSNGSSSPKVLNQAKPVAVGTEPDRSLSFRNVLSFIDLFCMYF